MGQGYDKEYPCDMCALMLERRWKDLVNNKYVCFKCFNDLQSDPMWIAGHLAILRGERISTLSKDCIRFTDHGSYMEVTDPELIILIREQKKYLRSIQPPSNV